MFFFPIHLKATEQEDQNVNVRGELIFILFSLLSLIFIGLLIPTIVLLFQNNSAFKITAIASGIAFFLPYFLLKFPKQTIYLIYLPLFLAQSIYSGTKKGLSAGGDFLTKGEARTDSTSTSWNRWFGFIALFFFVIIVLIYIFVPPENSLGFPQAKFFSTIILLLLFVYFFVRTIESVMQRDVSEETATRKKSDKASQDLKSSKAANLPV